MLLQIGVKCIRVNAKVTRNLLLTDARSVFNLARRVSIGRLEKQSTPDGGHKLTIYSKGTIVKNNILALLKVVNSWNIAVCSRLALTTVNMEASAVSSPVVFVPEHVRGMKVLVRDAFKCSIAIPSILVPHAAMRNMQKRKGDVVAFRRRGIKPLVELAEDDPSKATHKRMLLDPERHASSESLPSEKLTAAGVDIDSWRLLDIELGYENWTHSEILKAVLPVESDGVTGFSQAGHIVHVNLRDEVLEYKTIIGDVLLDKVSQARTVVNKANTINNEFRNFQVELIAGEKDYVTEVKRNNMTFEFDFSQVFWNSRLDTEHRRIYDLLRAGDTVFDMFAGVGPFSVPAAKKKCKVFANDINPESYKWLMHNATRNKVKDNLAVFNKDGRDFARDVIKPELAKLWQQSADETNKGNSNSSSVHIVMNLPALAVEFLDVFRGLMLDVDAKNSAAEGNGRHRVVPTKVHCYSFSKCEDTKSDVTRAAEHVLSCELPDCESRVVRNVAPKKDMVYISFALRQELLLGEDGVAEPDSKRRKVSHDIIEGTLSKEKDKEETVVELKAEGV